nr:MAG TPA: hypothetical protein [Caudoviricetes sp.]
MCYNLRINKRRGEVRSCQREIIVQQVQEHGKQGLIHY